MQGQKNPQRSFLDAELEGQVSRSSFLDRVEAVMDWKPLADHWSKLYGKTGKPSHPPLITFKMLLLQQWFNGLSDEEVEWQCRDRLSFRKFLGVSRTEDIPDSTTLVRFRQRLIQAGVMQAVFDAVTTQLEARHLLLKQGTLVDATIVESARTPPPKWGKDQSQDTSDPDAAWAGRNGRATTHGYKVHVAVDQGSELVRALSVTPGSAHDSTQIDALLSQDTEAVYADKAYDSTARRATLRAQGIAPRILHRARAYHPLTERQHRENRRWIPVRAQVERIFADWKERRSLRRARYVGLVRNTLHVMLLATAHNLRRWTVLAQAECL
jgi:IS5 family transposase